MKGLLHTGLLLSVRKVCLEKKNASYVCVYIKWANSYRTLQGDITWWKSHNASISQCAGDLVKPQDISWSRYRAKGAKCNLITPLVWIITQDYSICSLFQADKLW